MPINSDQFWKLFSGGMAQGSAGAQNASDNKLRQLLQTQAQQAKAEEAARQKAELEALSAQNPKASVRVGEYSVNPEPFGSLKALLTPAQEAAERVVGKQVADWEASGGRPAMEKNVEALTQVQSELADGKRDWYDRVVGGALSPHPTLMGVLAPTEKGRRDKARNPALAIARQSDPNPTEKQIETILGQVYDPASDNEGNKQRIDRFLKEQEATAANREAAAQNYNRTGYATIGGVRPQTPTQPAMSAPAGAETPEQKYLRLKAKYGR